MLLNNAQKTAKLVETDISKSHQMTRWNCCLGCTAPQTGSDGSEWAQALTQNIEQSEKKSGEREPCSLSPIARLGTTLPFCLFRERAQRSRVFKLGMAYILPFLMKRSH